MPIKKNSIVLLAKKSGVSSFSSLWQVKNALNTKKVGHTGTLDAFADGLLVTLSGFLTRLSTYLTQCDKEYLCLIEFGKETDTLDPDGSLINTSELPTLKHIKQALTQFQGTIYQMPPQYSAIRFQGKRASDYMREGQTIQLKKRKVTIYSIDFIDAKTLNGLYPELNEKVQSIIIKVFCSKGTYMRSLARDLAYAVQSCAYLSALRRTKIGPFTLENAAGYNELKDFNFYLPVYYAGIKEKPKKLETYKILEKTIPFTIEYAQKLDFIIIELNPQYYQDFSKGKKIQDFWFLSSLENIPKNREVLTFCENNLIGAIRKTNSKFTYDFVIKEAICTF